MRRAILATSLAWSGCFLFGGPEERHGRVEPAPPPARVPDVWDRHVHGDAPPDTRVAYRVNDHEIEIAALGEGWFEVRDTREGPGVSRRRVAGGRVVEAWYDGAPQRIVQAPAGVAPPGFEPIDGARVRVDGEWEWYEDALGFEFAVRTRWSDEVPALYTPRGGLVLRETPTVRIEIIFPNP